MNHAGTAGAYGVPRLIHQLVGDYAARHPDKPAIVSSIGRLSYRALNGRANGLARRLRDLGVGPETFVGVCVPRSADAVVALLGIVASGGAPVLLDPALPEERIRFMLRDSGACALVTRSADQAPATDGVPLITVGPGQDETGAEGGTLVEPPRATLRAENAAHVAYTSGSTGAPKGVIARHETVLHCVQWARRTFDVSPDDRWTWMSSPGFGVSLVNELWPALGTGGTVHLPSDETILSADRLRDWLVAGRTTVTQMVGTVAGPLCALDWPADTALRLLLVTGEQFEPPPAQLPFEIVVTYGSTETTHITSTHGLPPSARRPGDRARGTAVGAPIAGASVHLLDDRMNPVPDGEEGEIYVGGLGLSRGYLGDPGLTSDRWAPDRFAGEPGKRLFRTGDLGLFDPDGTLLLTGRVDRQAKIRGMRVNLDEIEGVLRKRVAPADTAVTMRGEPGAVPHLVAYLAGLDRSRAATLYRELRAELPAYMVPADLVLLDALPRTPNGKLDRDALPDPVRRSHDGGSTAARPAGDHIEETLRSVWCDLLDLDDVTTQDDFFELGGHSLLAVQVMTAVRKRFGVRVDLAAFYERPTIAGVAALVKAQREAARWFVALTDRPEPPLRLLCFPFAGGGPSAFASWADVVPSNVELSCLLAPGRAERLSEPPIAHVTELVEAIGCALLPSLHLRPPYAFFGHCLGAIVAFELARWLREHGQPLPARLFVSGLAGPRIPVLNTAHKLPDQAFVEHLRELRGTPQGALDDERVREVVLPALRADFTMHETYRYRARPPLECSITAFDGIDDPGTTPPEVDAWAKETSASYRRVTVPGSHFILDSARERLIDEMLADLSPMIEDSGGPT